MNLRRLASHLAVLLLLAARPRWPPPLRCRRRPIPTSAGAWSARCAAGWDCRFRGSGAAGDVLLRRRRRRRVEDHRRRAHLESALRRMKAGVGRRAGVAPSDPDVLYVGTGQVTTRWDIAVRRRRLPLRRRRQDLGAPGARATAPHRPHLGRSRAMPTSCSSPRWGTCSARTPSAASSARTDGGKSWKKVLFVDDNTGAVDLAADPGGPGHHLRLDSGRCATTPGSPTSRPIDRTGERRSTSRPTAARPGSGSPAGLAAGPTGPHRPRRRARQRRTRVYATIESGSRLRPLPLRRRRRPLAAGQRHGEPRQRLLHARAHGRSRRSRTRSTSWGSRSAARPMAARPSSSSAARRAATTTTSCGSIPNIRSG